MSSGRLRTFVVAVAFVLPACGGSPTDGGVAPLASAGDGTRDSAASNADTATDGAGGTAGMDNGSAGTQLLSFSAPAIGGGSIAAADFRGRPTLLWFWAPW